MSQDTTEQDPPHGSDRRRRRPTPPTSLPDHFTRKGYLSVSDLVGPSWCEYSYQYAILSLSHLPPSQRPATITTAEGTTLAAQPELVQQKDKTLTAGKAVHAVLEKEVAPVQIYVETETREDSWALRLLNLWCHVVGLLRLEPGSEGKQRGGMRVNCVREVPVYGWIKGVLFMGVIDEIDKRRVDVGDGGKKEKRVWASQEQWKKDQLRKAASTSPKKGGDADAKKNATKPLTAFFGSSQPQPEQPSNTTEEEHPKQGWGYFLSDTKTRISSWLPAEEDQFSARMQCMTYKRLFDGLCFGAISSSPTSTISASVSANTSTFHRNTTPMDWRATFGSLDLDPHRPLSSVFLRDAIPLCGSWGTDLALWIAERDADVCTLDHIRLLLESRLRELVADARRGQCLGEGERAGVIQDSLALTYRRQSQRRRRKRKKAVFTTNSVGEGQADGLRQKILPTTSTEETAEEVEAAVEPAPPLEQEARKSIDAIQGHHDASAAIEQALSAPSCTPKKPSLSQTSQESSTSPTSPPPGEEGKGEEKTNIIGLVTFPYDPQTLDDYLSKMIAMWKGERSLVGVSVDQTKRCWTCEWMDGCEWRTSQSLQHQNAAQQKALARIQLTPAPAAKLSEAGEYATLKAVSGEEEKEGEEEFWSNLDLDSITVKDSAGNVLDW
ncbi:hypothetical protein NDA18_005596 [Ustilago nuda]|nr:hypothetical protein NDA18_005596 [Ustilago nuda]